MTEKDNAIIARLSGIIDHILSGYSVSNIRLDGIERSENQAINELSDQLVGLIQQYRDSYRFILDLAGGRLNTDPPRRNVFADPFKHLQSDLRHLTWQIQEIANGDYDQRVSFSGDFSEAFNKMIIALRERQALADTIQENEQLFRSIFDTSPDGMLVCNLDYRIDSMSISAAHMLQLSEDDLKKTVIFDHLIADKDQEAGKRFFEKLHEGEPMVSTELKLQRTDGTTFWSEQNAGIFNDSKGAPRGIVIIFRDISVRKANEEQIQKYTLELKESNATKDKLYSIIAHDLKNPFNALLGFSDILLKEVKSGDLKKIEKYARILNDSAKRGYDLLINLLEWARLQSGRIVISKKRLSLLDVINHNINVLSSSALSKNISIKYLESIDYTVNSDKALLDTIFRNLLSNAIKYTPNGGEVIISVKPNNNFYYISIIDNGIGITKENAERLFRANEVDIMPGTNNEKGTGLGLLICKEFVDKLGGEIWVESTFKHGTVFTFTLLC